MNSLNSGIENLRDALGRIAKGERGSGTMAREYENIASAALDSEALASDGEALLRTALGQIANGDSYYGSMAREYKNIARTALGLGLLGRIGEDDFPSPGP